MWDKFGEFDSAEELNELAVNLREEGDAESLEELAKENGIDIELAEVFMEGEIPYLCDDMTAAIGKIDVEAAELKPAEIMEDWIEYLRARCFEDVETARAVRQKKNSLKGAIAELLKWSFEHQYPIDKDILRAAGVTAGKVTLGIPGMGQAKKIMTKYYLGGK